MQAFYDKRFSRETGCTEQEWLGWLPAALGQGEKNLGQRQAWVLVGDGRLTITWMPMPDRQIALVRIPRLLVDYEFVDVGEEQRTAFMVRFDLYMQRGGG